MGSVWSRSFTYLPAGDRHLPVPGIWYWYRCDNRNSNCSIRDRSYIRHDSPSRWLPILVTADHAPVHTLPNSTSTQSRGAEAKSILSISMADVGGSSSSSDCVRRSRQRAARRFLCGSWSRYDRIIFAAHVCAPLCKLYITRSCTHAYVCPGAPCMI